MKKILLLDTGREWGGGTNSLLELLKRVDRGRYRFDVMFYDNYRKGDGPDVRSVVSSLGHGFLLKGRRAIPAWAKAAKEGARVLLSPSRDAKARAIFAIDLAWRIRPDAADIARVLREGGYDLLYMNNQPSTNLEGILAAGAAGVPSLQHSRIETSLNAFEADAVNRHLTRMICVSDGVKEGFAARGVDPGRMTVVYNGIDSGSRPAIPADALRREWKIPPDHVLVGTTGSLIPRKRVGDFLAVLSLVSGKGTRRVSGIVVGDGPEMGRLRDEARRLGVDGACRFTGFQAEALSFIAAMDVFVLATEREGFPRVLLEAMLMGKPSVASRVAGPEQLVRDGETGYLVPVGKTNGFAAAVNRLVVDEALRKGMGERARERVVAEYSIERYVQGVERVFREVLGG